MCPRQSGVVRICWQFPSRRHGFSAVPFTSRTSSPERTRSSLTPTTCPAATFRDPAAASCGASTQRPTTATYAHHHREARSMFVSRRGNSGPLAVILVGRRHSGRLFLAYGRSRRKELTPRGVKFATQPLGGTPVL